MAKIIEKSELALLATTIGFQVVSMLSLLRVATGVASTSQPSSNSSTPVIVVPSLNQSVVVPISTPQFSNPVGSGLSAGLILAILFVGANIVVISLLAFLYRKRRMKLFSIIISLFLIFNVTYLYGSFILGLYSSLPFVLAVVASVITIGAALLKSAKLINALALLLALELGSAFPVLLQTPLNWIVPAVYAVFDVYAIYYGRLGKLVKQVGKSADESKEKQVAVATEAEAEKTATARRRFVNSAGWPDFGLLTVSLGKIEIGMADIAFYSMVPAVALILKSLLAFVIVMIAVDIGLVVSFYAFKNREVAPGLPIPILSGLFTLLVVMLV